MTNLFTVTEIDEDNGCMPWVHAYTNEAAAHKAIIDHHAELWGEAAMDEEGGALQALPTSDTETVLCLAEDTEIGWPRWVVTKATIVE